MTSDEPPSELYKANEVGTEAINRQKAIEIVEKYFEKIGLNGDICVDGLRQLPPIQPKRGRWHYSDGKPARIGLSFGVICDQCGTESEYCTNFCGECGADMKEVTT